MGIEPLGSTAGVAPRALDASTNTPPPRTSVELGGRLPANDRGAGAAFDGVAATPAGRATLHRAGFDQSRPPTPKDLLDYLSRRPYGISTPTAQGIATFRQNVGTFLDDAKESAAARPDATPVSIALAQNTALKMVYAALATELPRFQWTFVGGFVAQQVRGKIEELGVASSAGKAAGVAIPVLAPAAGPGVLASSAAADHIIGKLIEGQRTVVTDVGSYALAYRAFGAEPLSKVAPQPRMREAFVLQAHADAAMARGDGRAAADLGRRAAVKIGVFEQNQLEPMWKDPVVRYSAQMAAAAGMVDTDIETAIGTITTPRMEGGPWDLNYRVGIAQNAFQYMADNVFTPSDRSARNQIKVEDYFRSVWTSGNPQWGSADGTR